MTRKNWPVTMEAAPQLRVEMIGGFTAYMNGRVITDEAWPGRRSAELVQLLSLTGGHRLTRDQVMEALWPHLDANAAAANLRKAAHQARQALGDSEAVVLRKGMVGLFPSSEVVTDLEEFEAAAENALAEGDDAKVRGLIELFSGELLPDSSYEEWTQSPRRRLEATRIELMRLARLWENLIELNPLDELGYRELMREALKAGNRARAIQWYGRLRTVLATQLSISPGVETQALYRQCIEDFADTPSDFVGRQAALATATSAIHKVDRSRVTSLIVRGETGIGKTRFTVEVSELAGAEGWMTMTARCGASGRPYQPLASLVEQAVSSDPNVSAPASALETFSFVVNDHADPDAQVTRHRVAEAFRRTLDVLEDDDVLVVIDDVHLADEATIDVLLRELAMGSMPATLIVLAYDPESAPRSLLDGIARLEARVSSTEIELEPLSPAETESLIRTAAGPEPSDGAVSQVLELAQGNPALAVELANSIDTTGELRVTSSLWETALSWREDLDEVSLAVTERLALAAEDLNTDEVLAITGLEEEEAYRLLDGLMDKKVLEVTDGRYRFRRELVRRALCDRIPPHRQLSIHRDVARRLESHTPTQRERIARHWLQGSRPGKAIPWFLSAARHAMNVGAFADGLTHAETVLAHELSNREALALKADSLAALGRAEAVPAYAEAATHAGQQEAHDLKARLALAQLKSGDPNGALQTLETVTPMTLSGRISEALTLSGAAAIGFGDPGIAADKAGEARRLALEEGDSGAIVEASWALSLAAHARGALRSSIRSDLALSGGLGDLAIRVFDGYLCATERLLYGSHPYDEVVQFAESLREEAERIGALRGQGFALTLAGEARLLAGQLDDAASDLEHAANLNRSIGATAGEALALQRRAEVDHYRGKPEDARPLLARALLVARESYLGHHLLDRIYGAMITVEENQRNAMDLVEEAEGAVVGPLETCPACRITFEVPAVIASARFGDLPRAERHLNAVDMLSTVMVPQPGWQAAANEARGHLVIATGETAQARSHFKRAAELYRSAGQPLDMIRCQELASI